MNNKESIKKIAGLFSKSLGFTPVQSKTGSALLFDNDIFTALFRERFGINAENKDAFNAAFSAVTEGVGNEITKINSVISSALLPLLVFYKLYLPKEGNSIHLTLGGEKIEFTRAFYEVRNKVIGFPSCIDVALVSRDGDTILFLESKLTEMFEDLSDKKEYGSSYKPLYIKRSIKYALGKGGITVDENATNLVLRSTRPQYIEGIKQTISHLIGLVKGPADAKNQQAYIAAYHSAKRLIFSPILYDTSYILKEDQPDECAEYASLYATIFGNNKDAIIEDIKNWAGESQDSKPIEILPAVLTYQSLTKENENWLDERVGKYYNL